jgi:hypothetical protein
MMVVTSAPIISTQCDELQGGLSLEQAARQHSVLKHADAMEARAHMQLQLEETARQLAASRAAHAALQEEHDAVSARYAELKRQCKGVRALHCFPG